MLTAGTLAGAQEFLASWLAKDRNKHGNYFTSRVPKMAAYGALVSAPLGHFLIWLLQKLFKGRVSLRAKIIQIVVSNLVVRVFFFPLVNSPINAQIGTLVSRIGNASSNSISELLDTTPS